MVAWQADDILAHLQEILRNFEDREYSAEITPDTWFFADLGFASIDAIVLGERLEEHFGQPLPFSAFLSHLAEQQVQDIQVGQLVDFLVQSLNP